MTRPAVEDPWIGRTVGGEYRISALLGGGGFGAVYLADQEKVGRTVVVKVIRRALTDEPGVVARFQREARVIAGLDHPNIVKLFTAGETEEGAHYVVMEYAEGPTLADELVRCGQLSEGRALEIAAQIASALTAAHAAGIIHRDLKPANVILSKLAGGEDHARVLDFGIAKLSEPGDGTALTGSDVIVGTPAYMSPEQASGTGLDGRSDLYTLGVMLYEMVTGKHPFDADTPVQYIIQHLQQPITPPEVRAPGLRLSEPFIHLLNRACEKAPEARFESAQAMRDALRDVQAGRWGGGRPLTVPDLQSNPTSPAVGEPVTRLVPQPSAARLVLPLVAIGLLFVGAIVGVVAYILMDSEDDKPVAVSVASEVEGASQVEPEENAIELRSGASPRTAEAGSSRKPAATPGATSPLAHATNGPTPRPARSRPAVPTRVAEPAPRNVAPREFSTVVDEASGLVVPAGSQFRMRASNLISMDTPWSLDDVAEFLLEEFGSGSGVMINDNRTEADAWFGMIMDGGPLRMVRVDPDGAGTLLNYFVNND